MKIYSLTAALTFLFHLSCLKPRTSLRFIITKNREQFLLKAKSLGSKSGNEIFICQECGVEHIKWVGKCTSCDTWNSVKLFRPGKFSVDSQSSSRIQSANSAWVAQPGDDRYQNPFQGSSSGSDLQVMDAIVVNEQSTRIHLFSDELNRVLGGGLVKGSVVLCAGEPGVGKSTLFMQLASKIAGGEFGPVVLVSGEENTDQIVSRARRLELPTKNIYLHCDVNVDDISKFSSC